jgi:N,N'-diacetyllegionaminate synthase
MVEIIAEAAQGFLEDPSGKTRILAKYASAANADAVKFQLVYADELCTKDYKYYELFSELEMEDSDWQYLSDYCKELDIHLYVDIFGPKSLSLAEKINVYGIKLHSTDLLNYSLMRSISDSSIEKIILSTGGTNHSEIKEALDILSGKDIVLMHGFQGYPTDNDDNQIARINTLKTLFPDNPIGFAEHVPESSSTRFWLSSIAIGAGASVLEKHITTSLVVKEEDYESALNPDEFSIFVENMRIAEKACGKVGNGDDFGMSASEEKYRKNMKKQIVANSDLEKGRVIVEQDLTMKRTSATEDVIYDINEVLGKTLAKPVNIDVAIKKDDIV